MSAQIPSIDREAPAPITRSDIRQDTASVIRSLLDKLFVLTLTLGVATVIGSAIRVRSKGFAVNVFIDIVLFVAVFSILLLRKKVRARVAAGAILVLIGIAGIGNIITLGFANVSMVMFVCVSALTAVFYSLKHSYIVIAISLAALAAAGTLVCTGIINVDIDYNEYLRSPGAWIIHLASFALFAVATSVGISSLYQRLASSVTTLNKQSEELFQREQKYRMLADNMNDVIFIQDMDFNIIYSSPSGQKIFGYTPEEILELDPSKLFTPESAKRAMQIYTETVKKLNKGPVTSLPLMEFEYVRKDGSTFWGEIRVVFLYDSSGRAYGSQGVLRDITARKQADREREELEIRLRHSEKMEAIGQLAGGIAHDFNNHLTGIMGSADYIRMVSKSSDDVDEIAQNIVVASRRAADLVNKLLVLSRKGTHQKDAVSMHSLIGEVVAILCHSIDPRIAIKQRFDAERAIVTGDASQLENALLNLGINARDALPEGGDIVFSSERVTMSEKDCHNSAFDISPGPFIKISVTDNGTGMPDDIIQHIFEPFFTTKSQGKGTGMGLAAVYGTVTSHAGAITVETAECKGTSFHMFLPLSEDYRLGPLKQESAHASDTFHVLLVEDDDIVRSSATKLLELLGHCVTSCRDGAEAISMYSEKEQDFDLVLLDMVMPCAKGHEVFRTINKRHPGVKAILTSGYSIDMDIQDALDEGAKCFLHKPYTLEELKKAIHTAFS